jgi:RNA-directed DNA polymerase
VCALRRKLREAWRELKGHSIQAVLWRLNPIIRGWANYYRTVVSARPFSYLDHWMDRRAMRYARQMHPNKSKKWLTERYGGQLNPESDDRWVFGDKRPDKHGRFPYLLKFSWFKIVRPTLVKGTSSPDDASLREYWWARRKVNVRHLSASDVDLANDQDWACPIGGEELINGEALERHPIIARAEGGSDARGKRVLVRLYCHQQETAAWRKRRRMSRKESCSEQFA